MTAIHQGVLHKEGHGRGGRMTPDLADAAGMVACHAYKSIFRGARAWHGPTRALADLWTVYQAAWPRVAAELFDRDWRTAE